MRWLCSALLAVPLASLATSPEIMWQFGALGGVPGAVYSPDGQTVAAGGWDQTIKLYRASDGHLLRTLTGHTYIVAEVRFSPDGQTLASAGRDYVLKLWRVSDGQLLRSINHPWHMTSVGWSPDGTKVATACQDNIVRLYRVSDGQLLRTFTFPFSSPEKVVFSPNGLILAASGGDNQGRILFWNPDNGAIIRTLLPSSNYMRDIAFSPDGNTLASANGYTNIAQLWNVSTGALIGSLTGHTGPVWSIQYSHDGTVLATGSGNGEQTVKLWAMPSGTFMHTLPMQPYWVMSTEFSPDDSKIIVGSYDLRESRVSDGALLQIFGAYNESFPSIEFHPSGDSVATSVSSSNQRVAVWNANTGAFERNLPGYRDGVAISPNGLYYASTWSGDDVQVRRWSDGGLHRTLVGHTEYSRDVAFSSDSQYAATGAGFYYDMKGTPIIRDCTARLWRLSDAMLLHTLDHTRVVESVAISPDITRVATCGDDAMKLWDFASGSLVISNDGGYNLLAFSPDGSIVAAARDNLIDLFDGHTGVFVRTLSGSAYTIYGMAFSPTGGVLAAGDFQYDVFPAINFWRVSTGQLVLSFDDEVGTGIFGISFSANGQRFAYTREDRTVVMAANPFAPITVLPESFTVSPGIVLSGGLAELLVSDDGRLNIRPGPVLVSTAAPARIVLEGTSPISSVGELRLSLEARASAASILQTIELFDFVTSQYVQVDSRLATAADSTVHVFGTSPQRFVQPGTRKVRGRISWKAQGPVLVYPWTVEVDQAAWRVTN